MQRLRTLAIVAATLTARPLAAQDPAPASKPAAPCSYDACALRVEEGRVLRGRQGEQVGRLRWFSATSLLPLVGPSDSARFYASEFDRHYGAGARWSALGGLADGVLIASLLHTTSAAGTNDRWRGRDWLLLGGAVVGLGASVYGEHQLKRARRGLARAIWWHNRELAH
jgi:hypothetical protein